MPLEKNTDGLFLIDIQNDVAYDSGSEAFIEGAKGRMECIVLFVEKYGPFNPIFITLDNLTTSEHAEYCDPKRWKEWSDELNQYVPPKKYTGLGEPDSDEERDETDLPGVNWQAAHRGQQVYVRDLKPRNWNEFTNVKRGALVHARFNPNDGLDGAPQSFYIERKGKTVPVHYTENDTKNKLGDIFRKHHDALLLKPTKHSPDFFSPLAEKIPKALIYKHTEQKIKNIGTHMLSSRRERIFIIAVDRTKLVQMLYVILPVFAGRAYKGYDVPMLIVLEEFLLPDVKRTIREENDKDMAHLKEEYVGLWDMGRIA